MRKALASLCLSALLILAAAPAARPYTQQFTSSSTPIRWPTNTITVTLSSSINAPPAYIKAGSDVEGAVRRALRRWSDAANVNFNILTGGPDSVASGDGINLISVSASDANFAFASGGDAIGRTRVVFNVGGGSDGAIQEADIALNRAVQFSTDATPGTYDLESTFVHEIGHFLGLDHSALIGASMQPRQVQSFSNGTFTLTQTTPRTLSDDDLAGIRAIYGQRTPRAVGSVAGTLNYPAGAHVFVQRADSGRVVGSAITRSDGSYRIDQIPPGTYLVRAEYLDEPIRPNEITAPQGLYANLGTGAPFQTAQTTATVTAGAVTAVSFTLNLTAPTVNARVQGLNGVVHAGPMPVVPGNTYRYYVGGDGVDQIPAAGFSLDSPFFQIDTASYQAEPFFAGQLGYPVVSFNIRVLDTAKFGDFTMRLTKASGESVFLAAGVTVDPYTDFVELNPIDNTDFFVRQQYRDFLFREPEPGQPWSAILNNCPNQFNTDPNSPSAQCDRIHVSASFFGSPEFQLKGFFVYRFYRVAFGRQPTYEEIIPDMQFVTGSTTAELNQKRDAFANNFAARPEFAALYAGVSNSTYVNTLMGRYSLTQITTIDPANPNGAAKVQLTLQQLVDALNAGTLTRAQVLRAIADSDEVGRAEFNAAFVSMQYFGYLRRTAEPQGFADWLRTISANPADARTMVNGFLNSTEYRSRFGHV